MKLYVIEICVLYIVRCLYLNKEIYFILYFFPFVLFLWRCAKVV